jgi:Methyltransferase domain
MNNRQNLLLFLRLLMSNPAEFFDRAEVVLQARKEAKLARQGSFTAYPRTISFEDALEALSRDLGSDLTGILSESELQSALTRISEKTERLKAAGDLPFPIIYNADRTLALLAYLLCRILKPETVLETGVGYGVNSAMILAAMHRNGKGVLHSIDLPPIGDRQARRYIGCMVTTDLCSRWQLHTGPSRRILPLLLAKGIGNIGLFVHDSANIHRVQEAELRMAYPHLSPRAGLLLNNVGGKAAFKNFTDQRATELTCSYVIKQSEKSDNLTGLAITR